MSLPVGRIRVRGKGSDGGHNGLKSIIEALGTEAFPRLRVGIGSPRSEETTRNGPQDSPEDAAAARDHVLSRFRSEELVSVEESIRRAAEAAACWLTGNNLQEIMNTYNRRRTDSPQSGINEKGNTEAGARSEPCSDGES